MLKRPRPQKDDYTVGWICALQIEVDAARAVLDQEDEDISDAAHYILGRIGRHNVVIACPPAGQIGIGAAAITAERTRGIFKAIKYWFMVGIGGGVPSSTVDIRLGDVVISQPQGASGGVVQYDMGKTYPGGRRLRTGFLNAPPQELLAAITKLRSNINAGRSQFKDRLAQLADKGIFVCPAPDSDVLFEAANEHSGGFTCTECYTRGQVVRAQRSTQDSVLHYGVIASGNQVIKDGLTRDALSDEFGSILCFEMEAAGLMNSIPCLVVRGICDYADSHKKKEWQPYAAIAAACCTKEILSCVSSDSWIEDPADDPTITPGLLSRTITIYESRDTVHQNFGTPNSMPSEPIGTVGLTNIVLSEDERQAYFESLRFDQLESRHLSVKAAHIKTCRWLLNRSELKNWFRADQLDDHHGFLWIKGKAATGKSTIMKFMLSHVKKEKKANITLAFFFNARGVELEKSTLGMYRSLLYQLLEQCPDLQSIFDLRLITFENSGTITWSIDTLQLLLRIAIGKLEQRSMICLVDALDECDDEQAQQLVRFLGDIGRDARDSKTEVRILLSSRHYPYITIDKGISFVLEDQKEHGEDIEAYLQTELKAGQSQRVQKIRKDILERASGIFLWVVLVVDILNKEYRRGRIHAMEQMLKQVPNDIERLFDDILSRGGSCSQETALCLQWVLFARRPLKLEELYFAIMSKLDEDSIERWDESEITRDDMRRFILDTSRGLIEETKAKTKTFQFIHESVREFFLHGKGLSKSPFAPAETFPARSHEALKLCCSIYYRSISPDDRRLQFVSEKGIQHHTESSEYRLYLMTDWPFAEYALQEIFWHSNAAASFGIDQEMFIGDFMLSSHFDDCARLYNSLQKFATRRYNIFDINVLYPLADQDLFHLSRIMFPITRLPDRAPEQHHWLILAGLAGAEQENMRLITTRLADSSKSTNLDHTQLRNVRYTDAAIGAVIKTLREDRRAICERKSDTPIIWAARNDRRVLLRLLLAHPPQSIEMDSRSMNTAATVAAGAGHFVFLSMLLSHTPRSRLRDQFRILGQQSPAWLIIDELIDACPKDSFLSLGPDALSILGENRSLAENLVKLLLTVPEMNVNAQNIAGQTALHCASRDRQIGIVELLLKHKDINVNCTDLKGETPLTYAVRSGVTQTVRLLLNHVDTNVNYVNGNKNTPLTIAIHLGYCEFVSLLLSYPAVDVNSTGLVSIIPIFKAIWHQNDHATESLLNDRRIDLTLVDNLGNTPLSYAMQHGTFKAVGMLLRAGGAEVEVRRRQDVTDTKDVAACYSTEAAECFLDRISECTYSELRDVMALLPLAVRCSHAAMVELLLGHATLIRGQDLYINGVDSEGNTLLVIAAIRGDLDILQMLLKQGNIDVNLRGMAGCTAYWHAVHNGNKEAAELIAAHGGVDLNDPAAQRQAQRGTLKRDVIEID